MKFILVKFGDNDFSFEVRDSCKLLMESLSSEYDSSSKVKFDIELIKRFIARSASDLAEIKSKYSDEQLGKEYTPTHHIEKYLLDNIEVIDETEQIVTYLKENIRDEIIYNRIFKLDADDEHDLQLKSYMRSNEDNFNLFTYIFWANAESVLIRICTYSDYVKSQLILL